MFVISGASGQLGRAVVKKILQYVPSNQVVATCRDPSKVGDLVNMGVTVRYGDFMNPESLIQAFRGASQLLIVSSNARSHGGDPLSQHQNAIHAAQKVGVKRVVYTSHMAASEFSAFPPMHDHFETEKMLKASSLNWIALRHGFYGASGINMVTNAFKMGSFEIAKDGPISWTAHDDLAEAAAIILCDKSYKSGPTSPLTGPEALSFIDLLELVTNETGKLIPINILPDEELRANLVSNGLPARAANIILGLYIAARKGEFAQVDSTLANILGRRPMTVEELLKNTSNI